MTNNQDLTGGTDDADGPDADGPEHSESIGHSDDSIAGDLNDVATEAGIDSTRPSILSGGIVLGMGVVVACIAQYFAPHFDHQNANMISLGSLGVGVIYFLYRLQRHQAYDGHEIRVPAVVGSVLMALAIGFRFDGFNGEMLPQLRYRFASQRERPLREVSYRETDTSPVRSVDRSERMNSTQFLGSGRDGVNPERSFRVPATVDEVEVLWDQGIGDGWGSFAVVDGFAITLEQRESNECLSCYELATGKLVWIQKQKGLHTNSLGGTGPRSTPTIVAGKVYATTATGHVWCVDLADGQVIWESDLLRLGGWSQSEFEEAVPWGHAGSPLLVKGLCVMSLGGPEGGEKSASLIALDAENGREVWRAGTDQLSYASPMLIDIGGVSQIVSVNEKTVSGHSIDDGNQLWEFSWPGSSNSGASCASAIAVTGDRILVGKGYGGGSALVKIVHSENGWATEDVWRSSRVLKTKFNHACVVGTIAFAISNGSLQAVDLEEPRQLWLQPRRSRVGQGQAILVEDVLVVQDESGDLVLAAASTEEYRELLRIPALASKTWNIPTVAGNHILVRNDRQAICFRLPTR